MPGFFDEHGKLRVRPRVGGKPLSERDAIGLALLFAYANERADAVDFLLEHDGNWNMTGVGEGTALHRAAWDGDLVMVQRLIANGADIYNRENAYGATALSWARHNRQDEMFAWLRANTRVDIHDRVGFHLLEVVEARLREDPASVNKRLDHWDTPQSTPLYWAAWTRHYDVDGEHHWNETERYALVQRFTGCRRGSQCRGR